MRKYIYVAIGLLVLLSAIVYYGIWYRYIGCVHLDKYCRFNYLLHGKYPKYDPEYNEKLIMENADIEDYLFNKLSDINYNDIEWTSLNRYYHLLNLLNPNKFINLLINNYNDDSNINKTYYSLIYADKYLQKYGLSHIEKYKNSMNPFIRKWFIIWVCPLAEKDLGIRNILIEMKKIESDSNNVAHIDMCFK